MNKSESIKELATALSKAQGDMKAAKKDSTNPFFKSNYADLASVWDVCRKPLADNGLSVSQVTYNDYKGTIMLETILLHSTGEWLSGEIAINPIKLEPQAIGSAITYARRYALSAILGIAADDDDDGEVAMGRDSKKEFHSDIPMITEAQMKAINISIKEKGIAIEQAREHMKATFNKSNLKVLTEVEAARFINDITSDKIVKKEVQSAVVREAVGLGAKVIEKGTLSL